MYRTLPLLRRFLATLVCLVVLQCSNLIAQEESNGDAPGVDQVRRDLVPPGRGGGLYGNDLSFWDGPASDFFSAKPVLQAAEAISKRDQQGLEKSVRQLSNIDSPGRAGVTLLYWSYLQGNLEAFKFLLTRGASPDVAPTEELEINPSLRTGRTQGIALLAQASLISTERPGFFEAGLDYTKQPSQLDEFGATFLHNWVSIPSSSHQLRILRKIIALGVDLDARSNLDTTALETAAISNPQAMLVLLDAGANPNLPLSDGTSLIDLVRQCAKISSHDPDYPKVLQRLDPPALSQAFTVSVMEALDLSGVQQAEIKKLQRDVDQRLEKILSADQLKKLRKISP